MRPRQFFVATVALLGSVALTMAAAQPVTLERGSAEVYFAPRDDIGRHAVAFIGAAKKRVWVAGYYFTHPDVVRALGEARARGLDVRVVLDSSQVGEKYSGATYLQNHDVAVWVNSRHAVMHHKFIVVDEDRVAFGSANFTKAAMGGARGGGQFSNAENFNLFVGQPDLTRRYAQEFEQLQAESSR